MSRPVAWVWSKAGHSPRIIIVYIDGARLFRAERLTMFPGQPQLWRAEFGGLSHTATIRSIIRTARELRGVRLAKRYACAT